eukprot:PLAT11991.1.p1 GENE.PLAT11991.1~~PLAT11991.1.p1  ORF type:complete len:389 (-),score=218.56 PLAT11991.1:71-1237(-)
MRATLFALIVASAVAVAGMRPADGSEDYQGAPGYPHLEKRQSGKLLDMQTTARDDQQAFQRAWTACTAPVRKLNATVLHWQSIQDNLEGSVLPQLRMTLPVLKTRVAAKQEAVKAEKAAVEELKQAAAQLAEAESPLAELERAGVAMRKQALMELKDLRKFIVESHGSGGGGGGGGGGGSSLLQLSAAAQQLPAEAPSAIGELDIVDELLARLAATSDAMKSHESAAAGVRTAGKTARTDEVALREAEIVRLKKELGALTLQQQQHVKALATNEAVVARVRKDAAAALVEARKHGAECRKLKDDFQARDAKRQAEMQVVRDSLSRLHSGDCIVTPWAAWAPCDDSCKSLRYRSVTLEQSGEGRMCPTLTESRDCDADECHHDVTLQLL